MFCRTTFQNQNSRLQRFLAPGPRRLLPLQLCQDMLTITYDEITNGVQQIQCFSAECVLIHRQRHFVQQQSKTMSKLPSAKVSSQGTAANQAIVAHFPTRLLLLLLLRTPVRVTPVMLTQPLIWQQHFQVSSSMRVSMAYLGHWTSEFFSASTACARCLADILLLSIF